MWQLLRIKLMPRKKKYLLLWLYWWWYCEGGGRICLWSWRTCLRGSRCICWGSAYRIQRRLLLVISMKTLLDTELSVLPMAAPTEESIPESEIILHGVQTGKFVAGAILETAVKWNEFYLLFMTDDVLFEEALSISLFDEQFNILDVATLIRIYSTGIFSMLELIEPNVINFRFFW